MNGGFPGIGVPLFDEMFLQLLCAGTPVPFTAVMRWWYLDIKGELTPGEALITVGDDSLPNSVLIPMARGTLISVSVNITTGGNPYGQIFCSVDLMSFLSGSPRTRMNLCRGYVNSTYSVSWPYALNQNNTDGPGFVDVLAVGNPGPGAEFVITVPAGRLWKIISVLCRLNCDLTAVNRHPSLLESQFGSNVGSFTVPRLSALENKLLTWGTGMTGNIGLDFNHNGSLPVDLFMTPGSTLTSVTTNLQGGDEYSNIACHAQAWQVSDS